MLDTEICWDLGALLCGISPYAPSWHTLARGYIIPWTHLFIYSCHYLQLILFFTITYILCCYTSLLSLDFWTTYPSAAAYGTSFLVLEDTPWTTFQVICKACFFSRISTTTEFRKPPTGTNWPVTHTHTLHIYTQSLVTLHFADW